MAKFLTGNKGGPGRPRKSPDEVVTPARVVTKEELEAVRVLAMQHVPDAIEALVQIAAKGRSESARVAAISQLLDRACGKAVQPVAGDKDNPLTVDVRHAIVQLVRIEQNKP